MEKRDKVIESPRPFDLVWGWIKNGHISKSEGRELLKLALEEEQLRDFYRKRNAY